MYLDTRSLNVKGGTPEFVLRDNDQAERIVQLNIKVDASIRGASGEVTILVRKNREDLMATLPPRRVWLSIKHLRHLDRYRINKMTISSEKHKDKEDAIVDGKPNIPQHRCDFTDFYSEPRLQS